MTLTCCETLLDVNIIESSTGQSVHRRMAPEPIITARSLTSLQRRHGGPGGLQVPGDHDHPGASGGQEPGHGSPDAAGATGNHRQPGPGPGHGGGGGDADGFLDPDPDTRRQTDRQTDTERERDRQTTDQVL